MTNQQALRRLEEIVSPDMPALEPNLIVKDGKNYELFGKYAITPQRGMFTVYRRHDVVGNFGNLPTAVSWCVADKYSQTNLANEIFNLESRNICLSNDLAVRSALVNRMRGPNKEAAMIKIITKKHRLTEIRKRLAKCINLAKYWQIRGFNNETARTGRPASNRTSR